MDMFGPIQIRMNRKTRKEAQVIIFTCMTMRAIHLELVTGRSSEAFLMAFRRFACTRGHPHVCWSDRGTNFIELKLILKKLLQAGILPKFNRSSPKNLIVISDGSLISQKPAIKMEWWKA